MRECVREQHQHIVENDHQQITPRHETLLLLLLLLLMLLDKHSHRRSSSSISSGRV